MNIWQFISEYILIPGVEAQSSVVNLVGKINRIIINPLIALLFVVAFVLFLFGLFKFFGNREDTSALEDGKRHMMWGIIGMAIMVSVFGIMQLIINTLDVRGIDPRGGEVSNLSR